MPIAFSPQNRDAELGVIGSALIDNAVITDLTKLKSEHFYSSDTQLAWRHIADMFSAGKPVDQITLSQSIAESGESKNIDELFLLNCIRSVPHARHATRYAEIVTDMSIQRDVLNLADHLIERATSGEVIAENLLAEATQKIMEIGEGSSSNEAQDVRGDVFNLFNDIKNRRDEGWHLPGVPTGFPELDDMIGGLQNQHMIILAARPAMGKTGLALNLLEHIAVSFGHPVAIASLEMSKGELLARLFGTVAGVSNKKIKSRTGLTDRHLAKLEAAAHIIQESSAILVDDTFNMTPLQLVSLARKMKAKHDIKLFMIDYIQLVDASGISDNRQEQVARIARTLKAIARMLDIPVVALAQLNRELERREDKRPIMSDLRECIAGSSRVVDATTGIRVKMESIVSEQKRMKIHAADDDNQIVIESIDSSWKTEEKQLFMLHTESGRNIECTDEHLFKTYDGWVKLKELKVGDRVAVSRFLPEPLEPKCDFTDRQIRILSRMVSGGLYKDGRHLRFVSDSLEDITLFQKDIVEESEERYGFKVDCRVKYTRRYNTASIPVASIPGGRTDDFLIEIMKRAGVFNQARDKKTIPDCVFAFPNEKLKLFLSIMFNGDRLMVGKKKKKAVFARFFCQSKAIACDLQDLLTRFSIVSRLEKPVRNNRLALWDYPIVIDPGSIQELIDKVGIFGYNAEHLQEAIDSSIVDRYPTHIDRFPSVVRELVRTVKRESGVSWYEMRTRDQASEPLRSRIATVYNYTKDARLKKLIDHQVIWDRVIDIHPTEVEPCFDLTAGVHANYLPNQFVTHNSGAIEQDADIIMFIYRDEEYNKGTNENSAELIIAKNRHGETGTIAMNFHKKTTQFVSCGIMEPPLIL